jgi:hypothetical protein
MSSSVPTCGSPVCLRSHRSHLLNLDPDATVMISERTEQLGLSKSCMHAGPNISRKKASLMMVSKDDHHAFSDPAPTVALDRNDSASLLQPDVSVSRASVRHSRTTRWCKGTDHMVL